MEEEYPAIVRILPFLFWVLVLWGAQKLVSKKVLSEFRLKKNGEEGEEDLTDAHLKELEMFFHVHEETTGYKLVPQRDMSALIRMDLFLSFPRSDKAKVQARLKVSKVGLLSFFLSILLCYIGVLIPFFISWKERKKMEEDVQRIRQLLLA